MKKIGYFGTPAHSADLLEKLIKAGHEISFVVTNPDKPAGRKKILTPSPVKETALRYNIPLHQFDRLKSEEAVAAINSYGADIYIIYAYGKMIPEDIFSHPPMGTINLHGSMLPLLRGASPVQSALLQNFSRTGVSLQYIVRELDAGNIVAARDFTVEESDTTGTLFVKITETGFQLLEELLQKENNGLFDSVAQNHDLATHCRKLGNDERKIDFASGAREIFNKIRAFNPPPYAYAVFRDKRINLVRAEMTMNPVSGEAGTIIIVDKKQFAVNCGDTQLLIKELQPEGKKIMQCSEFMNGFRIEEGEKFS